MKNLFLLALILLTISCEVVMDPEVTEDYQPSLHIIYNDYANSTTTIVNNDIHYSNTKFTFTVNEAVDYDFDLLIRDNSGVRTSVHVSAGMGTVVYDRELNTSISTYIIIDNNAASNPNYNGVPFHLKIEVLY